MYSSLTAESHLLFISAHVDILLSYLIYKSVNDKTTNPKGTGSEETFIKCQYLTSSTKSV